MYMMQLLLEQLLQRAVTSTWRTSTPEMLRDQTSLVGILWQTLFCPTRLIAPSATCDYTQQPRPPVALQECVSLLHSNSSIIE